MTREVLGSGGSEPRHSKRWWRRLRDLTDALMGVVVAFRPDLPFPLHPDQGQADHSSRVMASAGS